VSQADYGPGPTYDASSGTKVRRWFLLNTLASVRSHITSYMGLITVSLRLIYRSGVPNLSLTTYSFSILTDHHVPLRFLWQKGWTKFKKSTEFL